MKHLEITVPSIPPSVNTYVRHSQGRHFRVKRAERFDWDVFSQVNGQKVEGEAFEVILTIWLPAKGRGDVDNFAKCCLDALVRCGVIPTDAAITDLTIRKRRDAVNPRTDMVIQAV